MSGPFTLGIWRHDVTDNLFALYKDGVLVQSCEQDRSMGNHTFISILNGSAVTTTITRVEWRNYPGGTLLQSDDCADVLSGDWAGQLDEPTAFPPLGSGWRNGATPGTFDAHDGSGGGKIISRAEPVGCEYVEVQGITFDIDGINTDWFGIHLHAIGGQEGAANYDVATTGGGLGLVYAEPSYDAEMPFCTGAADDPELPAAERQGFYYDPPIESLRGLLGDVGIGSRGIPA